MDINKYYCITYREVDWFISSSKMSVVIKLLNGGGMTEHTIMMLADAAVACFASTQTDYEKVIKDRDGIAGGIGWVENDKVSKLRASLLGQNEERCLGYLEIPDTYRLNFN